MDKNCRILLVDDQLLIAMDAEAILSDHGFSSIQTATNLQSAHQLVDDFCPQLAILDINIGSETSFALAKELESKNVKVAFASGYSADASQRKGFSHIPVISKPFGTEDLLDTIKGLMAV